LGLKLGSGLRKNKFKLGGRINADPRELADRKIAFSGVQFLPTDLGSLLFVSASSFP